MLLPEDYGLMIYYVAIYYFSMPYLIYGAESVLMNDYYASSKDIFNLNYSKSLFNSVFVLSLILLINIFVGIFYSNYDFLLLLLFFMLFLELLSKYSFILFRIVQDPKTFLKFSLMSTLILLSSTFGLLYCSDLGWFSRIAGILITNVLLVPFLLSAVLKRVKFDFNFSIKETLGRYIQNLPVLPSIIFIVFIFVFDKIWIKYMFGNKDLGVYSIPFQIGQILFVVSGTIRMAWQPRLLQWLNKEKQSKKPLKFTCYLFVFNIVLAIGVWVFGQLLFNYVVKQEYLSGSHLLIYNLIGFYFLTIFQVILGYVLYLKELKILAVSGIFAVDIKIIFNLFLGNNYGIDGIVLSFAIASFVFIAIILAYLFLNRTKLNLT